MLPDALFLKETIHENDGQLVFQVMFLCKTYYLFLLIFPLFLFLKGGLPSSQPKYCEV